LNRYPGSKGINYLECYISRTAPAEGETESGYEVRISDEREMERASFFGDRYREVIDHSPGAVILDRFKQGNMAFLVDHNPSDQVGVIHSPELRDRALYGKVRWFTTARALEVKQMVDEGRTAVSVGMDPKKVKLVEHNEKLGDLWRVLAWQPGEVSSVAIPANMGAGFGYSDSKPFERHVEVVEEAAQRSQPVANEGSRGMKQVRTDRGGVIAVADDDERPALSDTELAQFNAAEIVNLCEKHHMGGLAAGFISQGYSVDRASREILERKAGGPASPIQPPAQNLDPLKALGEKDRRLYSYAKAVLEGVEGKLAGREAEVDQELRKEQGLLSKYRKSDMGQTVLIPWDLRTDEQKLEQYTLSAAGATKGAELVFEQPGQLIELLRNYAGVVALGARTLTGLNGPIGFPRQTGAMTMYWVGENPPSDVTASDIALGMVTLTPRQLQGTTAYSRQLLVQASVDVEAMVRNELAMTHALAIDRAAIHGGTVAGEPIGVYTAPNVSQKAMGGAVDYTELTAMVGLVADANATLGSLGWMTTPLMAAKWLATLDFSAAAAGQAIWQGTIEVGGSGRVAGYRAVATSQVSKTMTGTAGATTGGTDHGIIFGNWGDMVIGYFGALEVIVDPYASKRRGLIEVTSFQMCDLILRHGPSFCVSTGGNTS